MLTEEPIFGLLSGADGTLDEPWILPGFSRVESGEVDPAAIWLKKPGSNQGFLEWSAG